MQSSRRFAERALPSIARARPGRKPRPRAAGKAPARSSARFRQTKVGIAVLRLGGRLDARALEPVGFDDVGSGVRARGRGLRRRGTLFQRRAAPQKAAQFRDFVLQPRVVLARGIERTLDHRALHLLALQQARQFLHPLLDRVAADLDVGLEAAVALAERRDLLLGAGERVAALGELGSRLFDVLDVTLPRFVRGLDLPQALLGIVAGDRRFDRLAIEGAYLLRAREQVLARIRQQPIGGCRTRLQRLDAHVEIVELGAVPLLDLVELRAEPTALGIDLGVTCLDLAELGLRRAQGGFALRHPPREPCRLVERLLGRGLQRLALVLQQRKLAAQLAELGLELGDALFRRGELLLALGARLGRGLALRDLLGKLAPEGRDLRSAGRELVGKLQIRAFQRAVGLARQLELLAQLLRLGLEPRGRLLDLVEIGAQRLVRLAQVLKRGGQAQPLRFLLLERAQRLVERADQAVEDLLEFVELADLAAGIVEEIAQRLVLLAETDADVGKALGFGASAIAIGVGEHRQGARLVGARFATLAAEQLRQSCHGGSPTPLPGATQVVPSPR